MEAVLGHDPGVLDPHAAETEQVKTRLDRDDVALFERLFGDRTQRRFFVDLEPYAVPSAVIHARDPIGAFETFGRGPKTAVDEHLANGQLRLLAGHARGDRLDARVERLQHGSVHAPDLFADLTHHNGACEVAAEVGLAARRKDVDDHGRVGLNRTVAAVVRQGTAW